MLKKRDDDNTTIKLDLIIELLRQSLAIELYKSGASKDVIGKHLHVAKASVVKMLKGVNREDRNLG
jgi:predicted transcriptional regulator